MTTIKSDNGAGAVNLVKIAPVCLTSRDNMTCPVSESPVDSVLQPTGKKVVLARKNSSSEPKLVELSATTAGAQDPGIIKQNCVARVKTNHANGESITDGPVKKRSVKKSRTLAQRAPGSHVSVQPTSVRSSETVTRKKAAECKDDIVNSSVQGVSVTLRQKDSVRSDESKGVLQLTKSVKSVILLGKILRLYIHRVSDYIKNTIFFSSGNQVNPSVEKNRIGIAQSGRLVRSSGKSHRNSELVSAREGDNSVESYINDTPATTQSLSRRRPAILRRAAGEQEEPVRKTTPVKRRQTKHVALASKQEGVGEDSVTDKSAGNGETGVITTSGGHRYTTS
jgi:hypothetical protein